ncbi:hypothetical protein QVD17_11650 [Tagetes erecta]|uniref:Zinc finger PHD-type domain-containing protein n=1 Tax=Tagetes erecta TaxID=13708 RepID=A0AAD8KYJ7_TARER|nr:hypothetical protein QVD17_11650 [Tagetes erecta]
MQCRSITFLATVSIRVCVLSASSHPSPLLSRGCATNHLSVPPLGHLHTRFTDPPLLFTQFHLLGIMDMDLPKDQSQKKAVEKLQKMHRSVLIEKIPDGEELIYISNRKVLLKGKKEGSGILCSHCNKVVSPTTFESHAGRSSTRKPYQHIFLENGMSLHRYASSLKPVCDNSSKPIACVLCRSPEFSEYGFCDRTSIICNQCEKEYHIGCLRKEMHIDLKELPAGNWFCTTECKNLFSSLRLLVSVSPLNVKHDYMQIVQNKFKDSDANNITNGDIQWIIFNGKDAYEEKHPLVRQVVDMFHDCFRPIIDPVTKKDFISSMAHGKKIGSLDFSGVYTALLTIDSKVISAGMFRVFGCEFAELPFVATSRSNQGKGFFQVFLVCFERLLSNLKIKNLVIPAAADAIPMWTNKFGFKKVPPKMLAHYRETQTSMVAFKGTTLLQRNVP